MIKGERIILRTVKEKDLDRYYDLLADVQSRGDHYPQELQSYADFQRAYQNRSFWHETRGALLIVDHEDTIVGEITFRDLAHRKAFEIGYIVFDITKRNQGIVTEALRLFTKYLFETKPIQRLELAIIPGNDASKRVAQKCGFTFEGISRQAYYVKGQYVDLENYALLKEEWLAQDRHFA